VFAAEYTFYIVSHGGPGDPFWGVVMKGMQDAADLLSKGTGDTIKATYLGPAVYSVTELVNMLNSAIAARPQGMFVPLQILPLWMNLCAGPSVSGFL